MNKDFWAFLTSTLIAGALMIGCAIQDFLIMGLIFAYMTGFLSVFLFKEFVARND